MSSEGMGGGDGEIGRAGRSADGEPPRHTGNIVMRTAPWVCAIVFALLDLGPDSLHSARVSRLRSATTWHVDYACRKPQPAEPALVVHDPDSPCTLSADVRATTIRLGYLSIGEVHESLPMFAELQKAGVTTAPNPDWPGAHYLDISHGAYSTAYLLPRARHIAANDFDGFFLDTLDSALERRSKRVTEAARRDELNAIIARLRSLWPSALIVPNGGLLLRDARPSVDGWAIEDVFGGYDFAARAYTETAPERQRALLPALRALNDSGLPVFVLDYAPRDARQKRAALLQRCLRERFHCAVDTILHD